MVSGYLAVVGFEYVTARDYKYLVFAWRFNHNQDLSMLTHDAQNAEVN